MYSLRQRLATLRARLVQKPVLALVSRVSWLRHLYTIDAVLHIRAPKGTQQTPVDIGGQHCVTCGADQGTKGTLLYLHGGGFTIGNLHGYKNLVARLGQAAGMRAIYLDYRLAPEHPFPAAIDDAEAAYLALAADPENAPVALAGDSAGGNIALALLHRLLAKGHPLPAAVALICPVTDLRLQNPSLQSNRRHDPLVSTRWGARSIAAYLGEADPAQPEASPIMGDFTGAPPVLIHTDTTEVLYDDARLMAQHLRRQDVDVTLTEQTGLPHVWHLNAGRTPEADESVTGIGAFLSGHAHGTGLDSAPRPP